MTRAVKKSATRKAPASRGAAAKKSAAAPKKRGRPPAKQESIARSERPVIRKRGRSLGTGRKAAAHDEGNPVLIAQLKAIRDEIAALHSEIQEMRTSIDVLGEAVDGLLKSHGADAPEATHESVDNEEFSGELDEEADGGQTEGHETKDVQAA